jgi:hypothetical protein
VGECNFFNLHQHALVSMHIFSAGCLALLSSYSCPKGYSNQLLQLRGQSLGENYSSPRCASGRASSLSRPFVLNRTQRLAQAYALTAALSLWLYLTHFPSCDKAPQMGSGTDHRRFTIGDIARLESGVSYRRLLRCQPCFQHEVHESAYLCPDPSWTSVI